MEELAALLVTSLVQKCLDPLLEDVVEHHARWQRGWVTIKGSGPAELGPEIEPNSLLLAKYIKSESSLSIYEMGRTQQLIVLFYELKR